MTRSDGHPLVLAGLWAGWHDPATDAVRRTFSIVTCRPNRALSELHDRMRLEIYPVRRLVNDVRQDGPDLIVPLAV